MIDSDSTKNSRLPQNFSLDLDFLLLLSSTQRNLKALWLPALGETIPKAIACPVFSWQWLGSLEKLVLPLRVDGAADVDGFGRIMRHVPNPPELAIRTSKCRKEYQNLSNLVDSVFSSVFEHIQPLGTAEALRLRSLRLRQTDLQSSTSRLYQAIDPLLLTSLRLKYCRGTEHLLSALTPLFQTGSPALQCFEYTGRSIDNQVLCGFFNAFVGLHTLKLVYDWPDADIDWPLKVLKNHGSTLARLILFTCDGGDIDVAEASWVDGSSLLGLVHSCPHLCEIALPLPVPCLPGQTDKDEQRFFTAIDALRQLKHLRLLKIVTWPKLDNVDLRPMSSPVDTLVELIDLRNLSNAQKALGYMDCHALRIIKRFANAPSMTPNQLPSIHFGRNADSQSFLETRDELTKVKVEPLCYLPTLHTDRFGTRMIKADRVSRQEYRYLSTKSCVVDF